ncbi:hypothetical protein CBS101457_005081 [Exobasidium rhododendri]|nr:hypothetical protein CBS101457_005081 [Exobasidium rhododendri]
MADLLNKLTTAITPTLKVGDKISTGVLLKEDDAHDGTVSLDGLTGKNLIIGVPGAFTPPCSSHVPGYVNDIKALQGKGVNTVYIVAVNDAFVTKAWKKDLGADSPHVRFLSDDTGAFLGKLGLLFDASGLLGNTRSQRFVAVVDNGVVSHIEIEGHAPDVTVTKVDHILTVL